MAEAPSGGLAFFCSSRMLPALVWRLGGAGRSLVGRRGAARVLEPHGCYGYSVRRACTGAGA